MALEETLEHEIEKERLRLEYAHIASEFVRWKKETSEEVSSSTQFGFTLAEVEAHHTLLVRDDAHVLCMLYYLFINPLTAGSWYK